MASFKVPTYLLTFLSERDLPTLFGILTDHHRLIITDCILLIEALFGSFKYFQSIGSSNRIDLVFLIRSCYILILLISINLQRKT